MLYQYNKVCTNVQILTLEQQLLQEIVSSNTSAQLQHTKTESETATSDVQSSARPPNLKAATATTMLPRVIQAARPVHELFNTLFRPLSGCIGGMQGEFESKTTSHRNGTNGDKTISNTGVPARCSASALAEGGGETNRDDGTFGESSSEQQLLSIAAILAPHSDQDSGTHLSGHSGGGGHALTLSSSIQHIREKNVSLECLARTRDLAQSFQRWNKNIDAQDEHLRQKITVMQRNVLMSLSEVHRLVLEMEETRKKEADQGVYHSAPSFESRKKEAGPGQDGLYHFAPSCAAWVSTLDLSQLNDIIRKAHLLDGEVQTGVDTRWTSI